MSTQVTFMLPDDVYSSALRLARLTQREVADVLRDLLTLATPSLASDAELPPPIHSLGDSEVLALTSLELPREQDLRLSALLERQQAGTLHEAERGELASLMQSYQEGLLRKAQAVEEAVRRGLMEPPGP
jgi:pyruvate-formate lyase